MKIHTFDALECDFDNTTSSKQNCNSNHTRGKVCAWTLSCTLDMVSVVLDLPKGQLGPGPGPEMRGGGAEIMREKKGKLTKKRLKKEKNIDFAPKMS